MDDRTEPENESFAWLRNAYRAVSFPGTSAQTADVSITSRSMRILNILHIILAYGFNTSILAISINVAAGFITL